MTTRENEGLEHAIESFTEEVQQFRHMVQHESGYSRPLTITVNAGGMVVTLIVLILLSVLLGFAYVRTQNRLDGLYDRLDVIYLMAPQLNKQEKPHVHHHSDPSAQVHGQQ